MSLRRDVDPVGWDWWGSMVWPPGLRAFDPVDWPAETPAQSWVLFVAARRAAGPPRGWRLASCRALT